MRDIGELFDAPIPDRSGGGCCDAGPSSSGSSGAGSLAFGALGALGARVARRRRIAQR